MTCRPLGFLSTTRRTRLTSRRLRERCASHWPACGRESATSCSSPRSPANRWTPPILTATTGSPTCGRRCGSQSPVAPLTARLPRVHRVQPASGADRGIAGFAGGPGDDHRVSARCDVTKADCDRLLLSAAEAHVRGNPSRLATHCSTTRREPTSTYPPTPFDGSATGWTPVPGFGRREQSRCRRRGASATRRDGGTRRFRRDHLHRPAVASIPSRGWPTTSPRHVWWCLERRWWRWHCTRATWWGARHRRTLVLQAPLVLGERGGVAVQVVVGPPWRRPVSDRCGSTHGSTVTARTGPGPGMPKVFSARDPRRQSPRRVGFRPVAADGRGTGRRRRRLRRCWPHMDIEYGPAFRGLREVWRRRAEVFVEADAAGAGQRRMRGGSVCIRCCWTPFCTASTPAGYSPNPN